MSRLIVVPVEECRNEEEFVNVTRLPWQRRYLGLKETVLATRALYRETEPPFHGELIDFDPVWFEPKPVQSGGPRFMLGAMGPLGIRHAAEWADGWMPVDVAMPNVAEELSEHRTGYDQALLFRHHPFYLPGKWLVGPVRTSVSRRNSPAEVS